jgi:hypothetical protein
LLSCLERDRTHIREPLPLGFLIGSGFQDTRRSEMTEIELVAVGVAAILGGAVNALAGGGTLITFPALLAVGIPAVPANVTNTVALCPGYLGGALAQLEDLSGEERTLYVFGSTQSPYRRVLDVLTAS